MESREELAAKSSQAPRGILDILGHLHHLSRHVAAGDLEQVLDLAVDLPIRCLRVDKCALLLPSAASRIPAVVASRNLSPSLREHLSDPTHDNLILSVASKSEPRIVEDLTSLSPDSARPYLREDVRSLAAIPVESFESPPGVLLCMMCRRTSFTVWEIELLYTIANHVAAATGRAQSRPGTTARSLALERLNRFDLSELDVRQLLERSLVEVLYAVNADSGSAMLCENGWMTLYAAQGLRDSVTRGSRTERGSGVAGWVVTHQEPVLLEGPADPERFDLIADRPEIVSSICVPLKGRKRVVGVLNVNSTRPGHRFGAADMVLVSTVSGHVALALENAILYKAARTQTRFLNGLFRIGKTITSSLDLGNVLAMIMEQVQALANTEICCLILRDRLSGQMQLASGRGLGQVPDEEYINLATPGMRIAQERQRYVMIPDIRDCDQHRETNVETEHGVRSVAIIPLAIKRRNVGYIAVFRREPGGLPHSVPRLLVGFAELAAIAIENARLYARQADIAHIMQNQLSPHDFEQIAGFDLGCRYIPADLVGGDYFDVIKLSDQEYGIAIADVSGKSTVAATYMVMCKHSLRALADELLSPAQLMRKMNRMIHQETEPEAFISMFYAVLNTRRRTLVFSCAGHEPGLLYRADVGRIEQLSTPGLLLGILPYVQCEERRIRLESGDVLMLYTDGLVDAISRQHSLALQTLFDALSKNHLRPAQEMADNIHRLANAQTAQSPDDIALLLLKAM